MKTKMDLSIAIPELQYRRSRWCQPSFTFQDKHLFYIQKNNISIVNLDKGLRSYRQIKFPYVLKDLRITEQNFLSAENDRNTYYIKNALASPFILNKEISNKGFCAGVINSAKYDNKDVFFCYNFHESEWQYKVENEVKNIVQIDSGISFPYTTCIALDEKDNTLKGFYNKSIAGVYGYQTFALTVDPINRIVKEINITDKVSQALPNYYLRDLRFTKNWIIGSCVNKNEDKASYYDRLSRYFYYNISQDQLFIEDYDYYLNKECFSKIEEINNELFILITRHNQSAQDKLYKIGKSLRIMKKITLNNAVYCNTIVDTLNSYSKEYIYEADGYICNIYTDGRLKPNQFNCILNKTSINSFKSLNISRVV